MPSPEQQNSGEAETSISQQVHGKPVSGRIWKQRQVQRTSAGRFKPRNFSGWEHQQKQRLERKLVQQTEKEIKEQVQQEKERLKKQRELARKAKEGKMELEMKKVSMAKIKRLKKKQKIKKSS
ncbi:hypothetical protein BJ742DRAFT_813669, partial [Cladochytrium replicatum]